jgi:hypothetical protein
LPHDTIVAFRERRATDLAVVPPDGALSRDDILAKDVQRAIQVNGLGEIDATSGDLRDCLCVCYRHQIPARRHDDKGIGAELVEDAMFVGPSPVWDSEPVGLVSAVYYGIYYCSQRG